MKALAKNEVVHMAMKALVGNAIPCISRVYYTIRAGL